MKSAKTTAYHKNLLYLKMIRLTKLTTFMLLFACLQVSARGFTQDKITLKLQATELKKALAAVEKVSDYHFLYNQALLSNQPRVNIDVAGADIGTVLNILLTNTGISYRLMDNHLVVLKGENDKGLNVPEIRITGRVTGTSNEPLAGVSVTIKGTAVGTTTDANGAYAITVPNGNAVLVFSYVGFASQEVPVGTQTTINISMAASASELNTVVVVGYGTQRKRDLTGSISSVNGEELARQPNTNPISSLQGKVPGLTVSNSGVPGSSPVVRIRGINSTNTASPVYVVDGILQDNIDYLNPADIESIDVLRDPSSIAIYGLRGANGVIAVTTKKAARGKTRISVQSSFSLQKIPNFIELTNAEQFKVLVNQQIRNAGGAGFDFSGYTADIDWQKQIFKTAPMSSHSVNISNSNDKSSTVFNIGYTNQEGVLRNSNTERYMVRLNQEIRINRNIKVGGEITGYHYNVDPADVSITNALWAAPVFPIQYSPDVYYSSISLQRIQVGNPIASLMRNDGNTIRKGNRIIGNLYAEIKFLQNFTWKSVIYGDQRFFRTRSYGPLPFRMYEIGENGQRDTITFNNTVRTSVSQGQDDAWRFQQDHTLAFDKRFGDHSLNAVAGFTTLYQASTSLNGQRIDSSLNIPNDPNLWYLGIVGASNIQNNSGGGSETAIAGAFLRASYSFKNRYLLNATIRRDGSSKFAPQNRWGTFGSLGAGWVVSDENFFSKLGAINFLKLRAAWGYTGNSNGIPEFIYRPGLSSSSEAVFGENVYQAVRDAYLVNPNIQWEVVRGADIGVDVRTLKNRLNAELTLYNRTTTDILTSLELPNDSRRYFDNLGKITNKGIELALGWRDNIGRDLSYSISANGSYNENVVNSIGDNFNFQILGGGGYNRTVTGESIGYLWGYRQVGIYQSTADLAKMPSLPTSLPGDIAYEDINGDGKIDANDRTNLGSPFPKWNYGGSINLSFKNLDFTLDGQGSAGHKIFTQRRTQSFATLNFEANRIRAWTGPGTTNVEPIINNRGENLLLSTYYIESGDFFRIRNIQLGYTFTSLLSRAGVSSARVYISGQNVKTWSRVTGYSPEPIIGSILAGGIDDGVYPVPAIYTIGLNVTF
jgi:TonB-linked SusC/RagA family outer membrane protein